MEKCKQKKKTGFTLIELLVVLAIIGMLTGIVLVSLGRARARARDVRRMSDIRQVVTAQQMYEGEKQVFFTTTTQDRIPPIEGYMPAVNDPQAPNKQYRWVDNTNDSTKFCVVAELEDKGNCDNKRFFIGYQNGTREVCRDSAPQNLAQCEQ
jgi:prepilin-type N-terminal cleavage/methylation domain-containing protein